MFVQLRNVSFALLGVALFSCSGNKGAMPNMERELAVVTLNPTVRELKSNYPAIIKGRQDIEIRPQVGGFITKLCVDEGSVVRKGQILFEIDPVQYESAVNVAEAAVKVAETAVATAELTAKNNRELARKNIISEYELQTTENQLATQKAQLAQAQAQLTNARKNLSYTKVESPSNGIVGTIPYRVGSLVSASIAQPLTTVSDNSEMFAYFSMNEKQILDLLRRQDGSQKDLLASLPQVDLVLADGEKYAQKGKIKTLSGVFDLSTGAATVRAAFANPQNLLRSGSTGMVEIPSLHNDVLVVPQQATYEIQDKKFVYRVEDDSTVKSVEIDILPLDNGKEYVVLSGLKAGDRIAIEGVGTILRDGMKIRPVEK